MWNAASGSSNGWQQWSINLDAYANKTVEISIAYISDWGTQGLGVFLDDIEWPGGATSFEGTDTGGWQIAGPPPGSGANANNWQVTDAGGFPVGAAITTPKSLLFGFGFEGDLDGGRAQGRDGARCVLPAEVAHEGRRPPRAAAGPPVLGRGES